MRVGEQMGAASMRSKDDPVIHVLLIKTGSFVQTNCSLSSISRFAISNPNERSRSTPISGGNNIRVSGFGRRVSELKSKSKGIGSAETIPDSLSSESCSNRALIRSNHYVRSSQLVETCTGMAL
jgi:hypothetical protein